MTVRDRCESPSLTARTPSLMAAVVVGPPRRTSATARRRNSAGNGRGMEEASQKKGRIFTLFRVTKLWGRSQSQLNRRQTHRSYPHMRNRGTRCRVREHWGINRHSPGRGLRAKSAHGKGQKSLLALQMSLRCRAIKRIRRLQRHSQVENLLLSLWTTDDLHPDRQAIDQSARYGEGR